MNDIDKACKLERPLARHAGDPATQGTYSTAKENSVRENGC